MSEDWESPSLYALFPPGNTPARFDIEPMAAGEFIRLVHQQKRGMLDAMKKPDRTCGFASVSRLSQHRIAWQFKWLTDTMATARFVRVRPEGGDEPIGQAIMLTRFDRATEDGVLNQFKAAPAAKMFGTDSFDLFDEDRGPLMVVFVMNPAAYFDHLVQWIVSMLNTAFFDQFGLQPSQRPAELGAKYLIFAPGPRSDYVVPDGAIVDNEREVSRGFREAMKGNETFTMNLTNHEGEPFQIEFRRTGSTAATVGIAIQQADGQQIVASVTALLTKLDPADDAKAIAEVRTNPSLDDITDDCYADALAETEPVAATFFADAESAEDQFVHSLIRMMTDAYFGEFGI